MRGKKGWQKGLNPVDLECMKNGKTTKIRKQIFTSHIEVDSALGKFSQF